MNAEYERHVPRPRKKREPSRWELPTYGRVIAIIGSTLGAAAIAGPALVNFIALMRNAESVPELTRSVQQNTASINGLKQQRDADFNDAKDMQGQIISRLDRIERKLDANDERSAQVKGWTR